MCNTFRKDDSKSNNFGGLVNAWKMELQECLLVGQDLEDLRFKLVSDEFLMVLLIDF